jgi:hypothetical protein
VIHDIDGYDNVRRSYEKGLLAWLIMEAEADAGYFLEWTVACGAKYDIYWSLLNPHVQYGSQGCEPCPSPASGVCPFRVPRLGKDMSAASYSAQQNT